MAIWSSGAPRITQLSDAPRRSHDFTLTVLKSGTMKSRIIGTPSCSTHCSNAVFPLYGFASNMNPRQASFPKEPSSIRAALACIFPFRLQLHDELGHTLFSIDHGRILQVDIFLFSSFAYISRTAGSSSSNSIMSPPASVLLNIRSQPPIGYFWPQPFNANWRIGSFPRLKC